MRISVIIPTLNEELHIGNLLDALHNQTQKPYEIIVVDGKSDDKTKEIVKGYNKVKLLKTKRGVGHQRSFGGKKAKGELLIFMDADVLPQTNYIALVHHHFEKHNHDIACPFYVPHKSTLPITSIYMLFNVLFFGLQKLLPSGGGMCITVKKDVFTKTGGFDATLTYDDIEFIRRASKGRKFGILPVTLRVSDRRFKKQGVMKTFGLYLFLSLFFIFGKFKLANKIKYTFGSYS